MPYSTELSYAKKAATEAGKAIASFYDKNLEVKYKNPQQPVTEADLAANAIIKEILLDEFAGDAWLSEEDADTEARLKNPRVWIVDPLDGTREFINKNPEFAVSIGLVVDGVAVVGAIYNPITNELFSAAVGAGAWKNKERIFVSPNQDTSKITLLASVSENQRGEWDEFKKIFSVKMIGGSAYKMGLVGAGAADGSFTLRPKSEWDVCAGVAIVNEAGGVVTAADGSKILFNQPSPYLSNLIYTNPHVYKTVLETIRQHKS
jgi:myo-inositol-1(or 4)-monophosphatase